jgi:glycosyltransferase involved in cell wall biosynthesis
VRIAYVTETYPPELNGVSGTAARAVTWLRSRGHAVHLVRPRQPGEDAADSDQEWRVRGIALPMYRRLRIGMPAISGLKRRWRTEAVELVHVATEGPLGWSACRAARTLGLPVTSDLRTNFDLYSGYYGFGALRGVVGGYLRRFHNSTDLTFVPTAALAEQLRDRGFQRLEVIGRGVDAEQFAPLHRSGELRQEWGAGPDDPVLLHVGRLAPEKNVELVLRAFAAVRARNSAARLVIVGDGPLRRRLETNAGARVVFIGERQGAELAACYASGDVFLFPSLTETFGNVTMEALASGLIFVAFRSAAAAVHVTHGVNGLLAPPGDAARFIELACRATDGLARLQVMRALARRTAQSASWDSVLLGFEQNLLSVRGGGQIAAPAYAA